jgi:hypothetical protein
LTTIRKYETIRTITKVLQQESRMNLNTATNEQLDQYRDAIAKVQGIDPLMLDYIWMDDPETGLRNRVLYAKRGVAEILRHKLGISVTSLTSAENGGLITFTATGVDKGGRQEMAVGSAYLEGLRADKRAHGVMTAQTKAVRRLTLQFVTGGILDETEVQFQSALQASPAASEATLAGSPTVMPPPQTVPSDAPGRDITPVLSQNETAPVPRQIAVVSPVCVDCKQPLSAHTLVNSALTCPTKADIQPAKTSVNLVPETVQPVHIQTTPFPPNTAGQPDIKADTPATEEPRKKRQYRRKNQVNIASPGQEPSVPPATAKEPEQGAIGNRTFENSALAEPVIDAVTEHVKESVTIAKIAEAVLPPTPPISVISKEKQEEYRTRLSKYYNDILPRGGMQSSESIGGPTMKTRRFAAIHTGVADTKQMTEQHWEDLFEFLDSHANDPKFLVNYINKALGVA